jgi:hypothetical protein
VAGCGFDETLEFVEDVLFGELAALFGDRHEYGGAMLDLKLVANRFRHVFGVGRSVLGVRKVGAFHRQCRRAEGSGEEDRVFSLALCGPTAFVSRSDRKAQANEKTKRKRIFGPIKGKGPGTIADGSRPAWA